MHKRDTKSPGVGIPLTAADPALPLFSIEDSSTSAIGTPYNSLYTADIVVCGQHITVLLDTDSTGELPCELPSYPPSLSQLLINT